MCDLEYYKTKRRKNILTYNLFVLGGLNTPPPAVPASTHLHLEDSTTLSAMFSQWKKSAIAISSWVPLLLLMLLDMALSKPVRIVVCCLFIEGHGSVGLLEATNTWARELCKSCTD